MPATVIEYKLKSSGLAAIQKAASTSLQLQEESSQQYTITYLDTFDWRIHAKNAVLQRIKDDHHEHLSWRKLDSPINRCKTSKGTHSVFATDLPEGRLKQWLAPIIGVRALLPLGTAFVSRRTFVKRNADEKIILRIHFDQYRVVNPNTNKQQLLDKRVRLAPLRGYDIPLESVKAYFDHEPALLQTKTDVALEVLQFYGYQPGGYDAKSVVSLQAQWPARQALSLILQDLFKIMQLNEEGVSQQIDSEFLHDYRVALRKTRSLCKQMHSLYNSETIESLEESLKWLGAVSGPARDMDVHMLQLDAYQQLLPEYLFHSLGPFRELLGRKHAQYHQQLLEVLNSERYIQFRQDYQTFLQQFPCESVDTPEANIRVKEYADRHIWKAYKKTIKQGNKIDENSADDLLHKLRRTCKRLRYLLEAFQTLYERKALKRLIKALKKLQDVLGKYNDLRVQITTLHDSKAELGALAQLSEETTQAISDLVLHLEFESKETRKDFSASYSAFSGKEIKTLFRKLFKPITLAHLA